MTNRREFLRTGMSVSALPLANGLASSDVSARIEYNRVAIQQAIFDDRYEEGHAFAGATADLGISARALDDGDVTHCYNELDLAWRKRPAAVAGLTQFGPMLVLERLGMERRMQVVLRIEHQARTDGTIAHVMKGPVETLALARDMRRRGVHWPALVAALAAHCPPDCREPVDATLTLPGARPALTRNRSLESTDTPESVIHYYQSAAIQEGYGVPWDGPLFSWVIVPTMD